MSSGRATMTTFNSRSAAHAACTSLQVWGDLCLRQEPVSPAPHPVGTTSLDMRPHLAPRSQNVL